MMRRIDPDALKQLVRPVPHKQNSMSYILTCPRCSKKDKLYLRKRDGRFVCFYCRDKSDFYGYAEYALKELLQMSLEELRSLLYGTQTVTNGGRMELSLRDFYGDSDEIPEDEEEPMLPIELPCDCVHIDEPMARKAQTYLLGRGIGPELWKIYGIKYWPSKQRVVFPVSEGETVWGYQARTIVKDVQPKILTSTGLKRDRVVMFADRLKGSAHAVVCEGPVDAIKFHLVGGNVATMGKVVTDRQIGCIKDRGIEKIYLALDPDATDEMNNLIRKLRSDFKVYQVEVPHGFKDFGEMPLEAVRDCFNNAKLANPAQLRVFLNNPFKR
jgi:hypothetical protein